MAKPRLFVEMPLEIGLEIELTGDAHHYLTRVMRLKAGAEFEVFNGASSCLNAVIGEVGKRSLTAKITTEIAPFRPAPNLTLAFAPIKKARTDFIVEKATELGARRIQPIFTQFTNAERIREDRLKRHAIEAAEQCGNTFVPEVNAPISFADFLAQNNSQILFCDETADNGEGRKKFTEAKADAWTIIIGPEGGFSPSEREQLIEAGALRLSLGPRILRADTAAVAAITLWQSTHGDWE